MFLHQGLGSRDESTGSWCCLRQGVKRSPDSSLCGPLNSFKFHLQGAALGALKSQLEFAFPSHCLWILSKSYYLTILFKTAFSSCQNLIFFKGYFYMCTEKIRKGDRSSAQTVSLLQQGWNWEGKPFKYELQQTLTMNLPESHYSILCIYQQILMVMTTLTRFKH